MGIYLFNYLSLPLYYVVLRNKKYFCYLVTIQLFLIQAMRDITLGVDLVTYNAGFQYIKGLSFLELMSRLSFIRVARLEYPFSFESGYVVLNWIVAKMGIDFHGFLAICAVIISVSVGRFIYKTSDNPLLSFSIFISFNMFAYCLGILRQSLALALVLWSLDAIMNGKRLKAFAVIMLAFWFHRTAILWLPLLFLANVRMRRKYFLYVFCLGEIMLSCASFLYTTVIAKVLLIIGLHHVNVNFQYNNFSMLILLISIVVLTFINFERFSNIKYNVSCWGLLLLLLLQPIAMCNDVFARASTLYTVLLIILIPGLIFSYANKHTKTMTEVAVYILMFGFMIYSLSGNIAGIVPYRFYF